MNANLMTVTTPELIEMLKDANRHLEYNLYLGHSSTWTKPMDDAFARRDEIHFELMRRAKNEQQSKS